MNSRSVNELTFTSGVYCLEGDATSRLVATLLRDWLRLCMSVCVCERKREKGKKVRESLYECEWLCVCH